MWAAIEDNNNKYDERFPITLLPFVEGDQEAADLFRDNAPVFWVRFLGLCKDEDKLMLPRVVIDGAHRRLVAHSLGIQCAAQFISPETSYLELVPPSPNCLFSLSRTDWCLWTCVSVAMD